jgi:hypothetical protein
VTRRRVSIVGRNDMAGEQSLTCSSQPASRDAFRTERLWGGVVGGILLLVGMAVLIAHESVQRLSVSFCGQYVWWNGPMESWRVAKLRELVVCGGSASLVVGGLVIVVAYAAPTAFARVLDIVLTPITSEQSGSRRLSWPSMGLLVGSFGFAYVMNLKSALALPWLTFEDGLTEDTTAIAFLSAAVLSVLVAYRLRASAHRWAIAVYVVAALAFFLVAMEEVSWGQRLLGVETPSVLRGANSQGEFNLHNVQALRQPTNTLFTIVSAIGVLGVCVHIALKVVGHVRPVADLLLPQPALIFPLLIVFVYASVPEDIIGFTARRTIGETRETLAAICALLYAAKSLKSAGYSACRSVR